MFVGEIIDEVQKEGVDCSFIAQLSQNAGLQILQRKLGNQSISAVLLVEVSHDVIEIPAQ